MSFVERVTSRVKVTVTTVGEKASNINKSLLVGGTIMVCATYVWHKRHSIAGYVGIGPYPADESNRLLRTIQRVLVDKTRSDAGVQWHPLNALLTRNPVRPSDNGHPKSGAIRDAARELINNAIDEIGAVKYEISPAAQSQVGDHCSHQHYAVGDLHRAVSGRDPEEDSVVVGIDVDYYLSDPSEFLGHGVPAIFHTFNPLAVSAVDGDSTYRIIDDQVHYDVSGGASWVHYVWDWCAFGEFVESPAKTGFLGSLLKFIGIRKYVCHKIMHSRPWEACPDRVLVWCIPTYSCWRADWIGSDLHVRKLKHIKYADAQHPGWNALIYQRNDGVLMMSVGRAGEDYSVSLPKADMDVLMSLSSAQSVTSRMLGLNYKDPALMALVAQYYQSKGAPLNDPCRIGRPMQPRVHWPAAMQADEIETNSRVYSSPLVSDENLMPMIKRWETLSLSLERRVTWVHNTTTPDARMAMFANEFIKFVVPEPNIGDPYCLEETADLLDKPSQTLAIKQIWETVDMEPRRLIEAFVKNEPCMKSGRIISSFADMRFLLKFSSYTLAFRDEVLHAEHNQHWFCPGLTPPELASKVVEYCQNVDVPIEGDFSNFDGTVSAWCQRFVMNAVYHRFFNKSHRRELQSYTDMLITCPARAKRFGFQYEAGVGVKSGSPTTCDLNTVLNAYIQYCAIRLTRYDMTPHDAFHSIGLAFGDDSLFERQYQLKFVKAATKLGMNLKVESYAPDLGITFLARVFPDPLVSTTSFQDPLRTWRKLHITSRDPSVPLADAAVDRVEGYLVTDELTPVTSNYCSMIKRYYNEFGASSQSVREKRKTSCRERPYWFVYDGAWPQSEADVPIMYKCISARTGFDEIKLRELSAKLDTCMDPFAPYTLNRDEEPAPYVDTLDVDAQPVEGRVDDRILQRDHNVNVIRVSSVPARRGQDEVRDGGWRVAPGRKHRSDRQEGSGSVPTVPRRNPHQGVPRNGQSPREATGSGVPQGRTTRPRGGRLKQSDAQTSGRAGQSTASHPRGPSRSKRGGVESHRGRSVRLSGGAPQVKV
jgi:hypothetical protein